MKSGIKNVKLLDKEVIEENGQLYLSLKYLYEAMDGIHELHIPRVALNILTKEIPDYRRENNMFYGTDESYICVPGHNYDLNPATLDVINKFGEIVTIQKAKYVEVLVKENQVEMTIEEIEKKLGHKIKIVSKDK